MQMAEEPDMRELLQRALGAVMGVAPPVRFQIGSDLPGPQQQSKRGLSPGLRRRSGRRMTRCSVTDGGEDDDEYYESKQAPHPWVGDEAPEPRPPIRRRAPDLRTSPGDLTRRLMESLGAEIVDERPAGISETDGPATDNAAESDLLELESSDFGLKDPELFDETDGEGDS